MNDYTIRSTLRVDAGLAHFIEGDVLAPLGLDAPAFWQGFAAICDRFAPRNRALLARRDELQTQIDAWHAERRGKPIDGAEYRAFLTEIGYLVPEPAAFAIGTELGGQQIDALDPIHGAEARGDDRNGFVHRHQRAAERKAII